MNEENMNNLNEDFINEKIKPYKVSNFNENQMYEIRKGLEKGLDVSKYADPKYNVNQMKQIRLGLEEDLDVSIYADPKFNTDQMYEILLGLEKGLDVSSYAEPMFSFSEMEQIRKGLEQGLNVSIYADPKYTVSQMRTIREDLEQIANQNNDEALKVLDYIQNEMPNEQRKKLFKDECGDFESDNEADQLKEFWDWIELLDSDDIEELGDNLNIIEEPEYQSDKELDMRKINELNDLEEKEKHSEELQNIDKNYQLKNGGYFHFHTNEEGYYYAIYDKFGIEQDGGLLEYSDNEENETLMSIRKRLAEFTDIEELADVNLKEVSQEDMDYITSQGQKIEERKASSDEEEDER